MCVQVIDAEELQLPLMDNVQDMLDMQVCVCVESQTNCCIEFTCDAPAAAALGSRLHATWNTVKPLKISLLTLAVLVKCELFLSTLLLLLPCQLDPRIGAVVLGWDARFTYRY